MLGIGSIALIFSKNSLFPEISLVESVKKIVMIVTVFISVQCEDSTMLPGQNLHQRSDHTYRLGNCFDSEAEAKELYFLPTFYVVLRPEDEIFDSLPKLRHEYTWTYAVRRSHEETQKAWESFDVKNFVDDDGIIRFPPQRVPPGLYEITSDVKSKDTVQIQMKKCYIFIKTLPPIAIIEGGAFQIVPSEHPLVLDGEKSLDLNVRRDEQPNLNYSWMCSLKQKCEFSEKTLTIPSDALKEVENNSFLVKLTVDSKYGLSNSTVLEVFASAGAALLKITCEENCLPHSPVGSSDVDVVLKVTCEKNCQNILDEQYEWQIGAWRGHGIKDFDYTLWTTGRRGKTFRVFRGIFKHSVSAFIWVQLVNADREGRTDIHLEFGELGPLVQNCYTQPNNAENLNVIFTFECSQEDEDQKYFYELYSDNPEGDVVVSGFYPEVINLKFQLRPSTEYVVKVIQKENIFTTHVVKRLSIRLKREEDVVKPTQIIRYKNPYRKSPNSISNLLNSGHAMKRQRGVELFQSLINHYVIPQMADEETRKIIEEFKQKVVKDLLEPTKDEAIKELIEVSDTLQAVEEDKNLVENDPLVATFTSIICRIIASQYANMIRQHPSPRSMKTQTIKFGKFLAKCLMSTNVEPNNHLHRPFAYNITIDEVSPVQGEETITENYPDYEDGPDYSFQMNNLKKLTFNIIKTTAIAAKTLAMTIDLGEHDVKIYGKKSATVVAKDNASRLAKTKITLLGTTLFPSMDLDKSEHPIDILISTWDLDLMWWNQNHTRVATPIVNIEFWHSMCKKRIKHFKSPASVYFTVKENTTFELDLIEDTVTVPKGYQNMSGATLNRFIKIRRVELPRRTVLHVIFYDLSTDIVLDVVVTRKYPTIEDFKKKKIVRVYDQPIILFANQENYDVWCYVAILANKILGTNYTRTLHFNLSLVVSCCLSWNMDRTLWQPACMPGKINSPDTISCECKHFSVIAGYMQNIPSHLQIAKSEEILIELQSFCIVFMTLAITFGIYCFLLIFVSFQVKEEIYYLADNSREDRYAYLIIARTEKAANAGTTSAVVIRVVGQKRTSDPHVLNYPDPKMRMLQKQGQDLFVMTTSRHLGEIIRIELWYDCTGASPSWYCRDILIYDMQTRTEYYFKVKTRFDVDKGVTFLGIKPAGKVPPKLKFFKRFRVCNHFHTWNLLGGEKNILFQEKLTIVLSTILMMYMFVLMFHGIPLMEISDCLDSYERYHISWYSVLAIFMSSLVSFIIHISIAWIFRFSNIEFVAFGKYYKKSHRLSGLCWVILIVLIMSSMSFLIVFGFWIPFNYSMIWLTCCVIGIFLDVIIFENILIMVQTYFCKFRLTYPFERKFNMFLRVIEQQRLLLYEKFDTTMLRPFFHHLYSPLQAADIIRKQIIANLRRGIVDDLEDLVMYGIYNVILYMVILVNRATLTLISKAEIESMLQGAHTRTFKFSSVRSTELIYQYINKTLIPAMQPTVWYANFAINDPGVMIDFSNKFIGIARLRQHRIAKNTCPVPKTMEFLNMSCWPEFSLSDSDVQNFGYGWSSDTSALEYDRMHYIWKHQSESETGSLTYMGEFATYSGGGYVAFLGRTLYNSYVNLLRLYEMYWIDDTTRGIFIEFLTYNANHNIFNAVRLLFEQSATGYVSGIMDISAVRMLFVENEVEIMTIVVFGLFMVWVMMLMFKLIIGIYKNIRTFYKKVWLMIDLFINLLSVTCIIIFIVRMKMIQSYLKDTEAVQHNKFVSYFSLFFVEDFLTMLAAVLVCVATARLWRFLRFGLFFKILERTLSMASFPLVGVTLAFTVILLAFGFSGLLIFGNDFTELSTLMKIIATLIQLTLKPEDYPLMEYSVFPIGYAYFSVYLLLMQIILFIYIVVIIMAYTKAQLEFSVEPESYTVGTYLKERIDYCPKLMRYKFRRLRGGYDEEDDEDDKKVKAKADEFRYANCIGIAKSKMKAMRFIISCFIRNMNQTNEEQRVLTQHETDMMLGVCNQFVLKTYQNDELELFFKGHFEGDKTFRLVDEKRIEKIADCVGILLEEQREEEEEPAIDINIATSTKLIKKQLFILRSCNLHLKLISCKLDTCEQDFALIF